MSETSSAIQIQDQTADKKLSVVVTIDDPTVNWVVVCNPDWTNIGS